MTHEFGGCLPLESYLCCEPHEILPSNVIQLNSGRSAIYYAVLHSGCHTIYLPYYTCPTIREFIETRGICVKEYSIAPDYSPNIPPLQDGEILLWTNYYGCMKPAAIKRIAATYGKRLIIDNCQAFFSTPISTAYNVYSVRKFVGIPCGAYVYLPEGDTEVTIEYKPENVPFSDNFLRVAKEKGSNAAYQLYLENEESFKSIYGSMPEEVKNTLRYVDFHSIWTRRSENFCALHEILGTNNPLPLDFDGKCAYMYPYFSPKKHLQKSLLKYRIFTPTWWRRVLALPGTNEFEKMLVEHIVPLPIDHRYSTEQMQTLAQVIQKESKK